MNLKEWAEERGISLTEAKAITGLTHWKQEVVEEEAVPVETANEEVAGEYSKEAIELSIRMLGNKSPVWNLRNLVGR